MMNQIDNKIADICRASGMSEAAPIQMQTIKFYPEIRKMCEENTCRNYNRSWACPPAIGTLENCKEICESYQVMVLFSKHYQLRDSWDFEMMQQGHRDFQKSVDHLDQCLEEELDKTQYLILSNEGCIKCEKCTYPEQPCRFPEQLHPSIEGFGLIVSELAQSANMTYHAENGVLYFGAVLANKKTPTTLRND